MASQKQIDWVKVRTEYVNGGISMRELAAKYGVSISTIYKYSKREKWAEDRNKLAEKVHKRAIQKSAEIKAESMVAIERATLLAAKKIEKELKEFSTRSGTHITQNVIIDSNEVGRNGKPMRASVDYDFAKLVSSLNMLFKQVNDVTAQRLDLERKRLDIERERLALQRGDAPDGGGMEGAIQKLGELFERPLPDRTIDDVLSGGDGDD